MKKSGSGWGQGNRSIQPKKTTSKRSKRRFWILQGALVCALSTVLWRVYDVQKVYGQQLQKSAKSAIDVSHVLLAPRGTILDAQGNQLAYDVPSFYVDIKASAFKSVASQAAPVLAPLLGTDVNSVTKLLMENYVWIQLPHTVLEPVKNQLETAFSKHVWAPNDKHSTWSTDITFTPTEQREYPYDNFAANTIGYVTNNGIGESGVELEYNKLLTGTSGSIQFQQDPTGAPMPGTVQITKAAKPGDNVQLTIDDTIQGYVEHEMDSLINQYHPQHAAIIVANPQTGAILAMSSRPSFNPNSYWQASPAALSQNWAVSSTFEPGSTFKPFVFSAALATNSINMNQTFKSGQTQVGNNTINDWNYVGWGTLTYQEALEKSSNVGFSKIALALGWPNMNHYLQLFGFLNKTGIDLPNEASSLMFPTSDQHSIQLATTGFGQGIAVTPLQQVAAMGAIANGGKLMKPYITDKITTPAGKVIEQTQPTVVRQGFIPQSVVNEVNQTLVLDVSGPQGIDTAAKIPGYEVAGKTGTAQIVNPATGQYYSNRFETSFLGYAPANDPKVEVYVTLYWPKTAPNEQWGSTVAIPPAKNIIQDSLEYYHIPPSGTVKSIASDTQGAGAVTYIQTPNIVGLTQTAAAAKLKSVGLASMFAGVSGAVQRQWPAAGIEVTKGSKMYALLQTGTNGQISVPDLTGLSLRDATNLLAALGLNIHPSGTGFVASQSVSAGGKTTTGASIDVTLAP